MKRIIINKAAMFEKAFYSGKKRQCSHCYQEDVKYYVLRWDNVIVKMVWCGYLCGRSVCQSYARAFSRVRVDLKQLINDLNIFEMATVIDIKDDNSRCLFCSAEAYRMEFTLLNDKVENRTLKGYINRYCKDHVKYSSAKAYASCFLKGRD